MSDQTPSAQAQTFGGTSESTVREAPFEPPRFSDSQGELPEPRDYSPTARAHDGESDKERNERLLAAEVARARSGLRPWQAEIVCELLRSGNRSMAHRAGGVNATTCDRWRKVDAVFSAAYEQALLGHVHGVEETVLASAKSGSSERLAEFVLKSRMRAEYGDQVNVSLTGAIGVAVMTPDQIAELVLRTDPRLMGRPALGGSQE